MSDDKTFYEILYLERDGKKVYYKTAYAIGMEAAQRWFYSLDLLSNCQALVIVNYYSREVVYDPSVGIGETIKENGLDRPLTWWEIEEIIMEDKKERV